MRGVGPFALIDVVRFATIMAEVHAAPLGIRKGGKSSVFSWFNLKARSIFRSEDVIRGGKMLYGLSIATEFGIVLPHTAPY